jgi:hypothetical protein
VSLIFFIDTVSMVVCATGFVVVLVNWVNSCCLIIAKLRLRNRSLPTGWQLSFSVLLCFVFGCVVRLFVL